MTIYAASHGFGTVIESLIPLYILMYLPIASVILGVKFVRMEGTTLELLKFSSFWTSLSGIGSFVAFMSFGMRIVSIEFIAVQIIIYWIITFSSGFLYALVFQNKKYSIKFDIVKKESMEIEKPL